MSQAELQKLVDALAISQRQIDVLLPLMFDELDEILGGGASGVAERIRNANDRQRMVIGKLAMHKILEAYVAAAYADDAAPTVTSTTASAPPAPPA